MRPYFLTAMILFSALPALAQSYAEQQYQPQASYPQQEANVTGYPAQQPSYPQPVYTAQPPQPNRSASQAYYDQRPTDAGQSVVTDVRQMNF